MREHLQKFHKLFTNFRIVADAVIDRGGDVSYEWPTQCTLWKQHVVQEIITDLSMNAVDMHGCAAS